LEPPLRGALVPQDGAFPVASRHSRAVNLVASDLRGRYFVSLITDPADWTELAVLLRPDQWERAMACPVGEDVAISAFVGGFPASGGEAVERSQPGERAAPPRFNGWTAPMPTPASIAACRAAMIQNHGDVGFVPLLRGTPSSDPFIKRAAAILNAVERWSPTRTADLKGLVGLGPGFTPAGDDFLSGVLLAECLLSGLPPAQPGVVAIGERLATTTPGGAALLRVALAGYPPHFQYRIVAAMGTEDVEGALDRAVRHGHSSGLDFLAGLIWALDGQLGPEGLSSNEVV
jgi:hypothetical protein